MCIYIYYMYKVLSVRLSAFIINTSYLFAITPFNCYILYYKPLIAYAHKMTEGTL